MTNNQGIDHIVDTVGGKNVAQSVAAVAPQGRVSLIGILDGAEITASAGALLLKSALIQGIGVGHRRSLEDLVRAVDATNLKPVIDSTFAFDAFPAALDRLDSGPFGKIVITL